MHGSRNTRWLLYLAALVSVLVLHSTFIAALNQGPRSTFTVNTFDDTIDTNASDGVCVDSNGNCSLRAAIMSANYTDTADEIMLPAGTYNLTRTGADDTALNGDLDILRDLTITGANKDTTIIVQTLDDRVFSIDSLSSLNITVNISGVTLTKEAGYYSSNLIENFASGILNLSDIILDTGIRGLYNHARATLNNVTITHMQSEGIYSDIDAILNIVNSTIADNSGAGIIAFGNNNEGANTTVLNSTISNNGFGGFFGGDLWIENSLVNGNKDERGLDLSGTCHIVKTTVSENKDGGIDINNGSVVNIIDSIIINNQMSASSQGAGIYISFGNQVSITGTTISGNSAALNGGGIYIYGDFDDQLIQITNSTISANTSASNGGGIYFGEIGPSASLKLNGVTLSGNTALTGGGIYANNGFIKFASTILYGNSATVAGGDCYDTGNYILSQGYNLVGDTNSCPNFTASGDQVGVNPLLAPLGNNGGFTQTHALQTGSPAINAGNASTCIGYDQRYYPRVGICDIGAYEADAPMQTVTSTVVIGATELLTNGDFEAQTGEGKPDLLPWVLTNGSKDKIKCNTVDKQVAYAGDCAFLFKGSAGEQAKLSQNASTAVSISAGDTLSFTAQVNAKGGVSAKVKIKVSYTDGTPVDKGGATLLASTDYTLVSDDVNLSSDAISKIKVQIQNRSTSGKIYLDAVSLRHYPAASGLGAREVVPLPALP